MRASVLSAATVAALVGYAASVAILLAAATALGATPAQTASWLLAISLGKAFGSALLSWRSKIPVVLAWSTPGAALIAATSGISFAEGVGAFFSEWGVDTAPDAPGGLKPPQAPRPLRSVTLLQRKPEKPGRTLGLSTGWALRARLEQRGLQTLSGCSYERIDDAGLHLRVDTEARVLEVDTVVICAGQESETKLADALRSQGLAPQVIGGAELAAELDALRAIDQGTRLAMTF